MLHKKLRKLELMEYAPSESCPEGRLVVAYFEEDEPTKDWASFPLINDYQGMSQDIGRFLKRMGAVYE